MPGPPKQFDPDAALDSALELFWQHGYERVSIDDLVHAIGISRASLYATFGDKQALFRAAVRRYHAAWREGVTRYLDTDGNPLENVYRFIRHVARRASSGSARGCFLTNTTVESGSPDRWVRAYLRSTWRELERALVRSFQRAIGAGAFGQEVSDRALAAIVMNYYLGVTAAARLGGGARDARRVAEALIAILETLGAPAARCRSGRHGGVHVGPVLRPGPSFRSANALNP